jgi:hypothetical protein
LERLKERQVIKITKETSEGLTDDVKESEHEEGIYLRSGLAFILYLLEDEVQRAYPNSAFGYVGKIAPQEKSLALLNTPRSGMTEKGKT